MKKLILALAGALLLLSLVVMPQAAGAQMLRLAGCGKST
jgi:hypothetical protein